MKQNSIEIFSDPTFSMTIFTTKCSKSDGPAGQCARTYSANLAKSSGNPHIYVQHLQLNTCLALRCFNNQLRVCVQENESRFLCTLTYSDAFPDQAKHSYFDRIATFSILSCQNCFFSADETFPETQKKTLYSINGNKVYLKTRIEGYLLILSNVPMCS